VPIPVVGPGWSVARRAAEIAGAPVPPHVEETLRRGRVGDGSTAADVLDLGFVRPTQEVLAELFEWASVTPIEASRAKEEVA
jgi:hypothetical protein